MTQQPQPLHSLQEICLFNSAADEQGCIVATRGCVSDDDMTVRKVAKRRAPKQKRRPKVTKTDARKRGRPRKSDAPRTQSLTIQLHDALAEKWRLAREDWSDAGFIQYLLLIRHKYRELKEKCTCNFEVKMKDTSSEIELEEALGNCYEASDKEQEILGKDIPVPDSTETEEPERMNNQNEPLTNSMHSIDDTGKTSAIMTGESKGKKSKKKQKKSKVKFESNECWVCDHVVEKLVDKKPHVMTEHCILYVECNLCERGPTEEGDRLRRITPDTIQLENYFLHMKTVHGVTDCNCQFCEHCKIDDLDAYRQHLIAKHGPELLCQCKFCEASGNRAVLLKRYSLKRHMIFLHSQKAESYTEKAPCEFCGTLLTPVLMERHVLNTHAEKRRRPSKLCDLCGKYYSDLKQHKINIHNKDKWEFQCKHCQKRFSTRWNLDVHTRLHTGERPYVCEICGKSFHQKVELRLHCENHHGVPKQDRGKRKRQNGTVSTLPS